MWRRASVSGAVGLLFWGFMIGCAFKSDKLEGLFDPAALEGHLKNYSDNEKRLIAKDLKIVEQVCFDDVTLHGGAAKEKVYVATAGAPGARKSTILERFLAAEGQCYAPFVYLDPDQRALKFMAHTYQALSLNAAVTAQEQDFTVTQKNAYEKWRAASNYITLVLLERALQSNFNIVHGTTSTGPLAPVVVEGCKKQGYKIIFLVCSSEDSFRQEAISYRNTEQKFYQSTPEDAVQKGLAFPQRMNFFFEKGDEIHLYWSDSLTASEQLAAVFKEGKKEIINTKAYGDFVAKYEQDCVLLKVKENKDLPSWEELTIHYKKNKLSAI